MRKVSYASLDDDTMGQQGCRCESSNILIVSKCLVSYKDKILSRNHLLLRIPAHGLDRTRYYMDDHRTVRDNHWDIHHYTDNLSCICHVRSNNLGNKKYQYYICSSIRKPRYRKYVHRRLYLLDTLNKF